MPPPAAARFNALLATASINDAIEYYGLFKRAAGRDAQAADPDFVPLNIACVFSPPAEGNADVQQIQEDLPQEKEDNEHDPEEKKEALKAIIADYNARFGTNHRIDEFDLYYQDVQKRIKDQQFPNADLPQKGREKIDITIVVDMLLTGFDSKYLNTLYVDKNLKHHGLIQAFSRTNRVLNDTKPYGHILDFRSQQDAVDAAIALFSGAKADQAREIWLVDKAPVVIEKLKAAVADARRLHEVAGPRQPSPKHVANLKGDDARAAFIKHFKEVQRLQTQLDQYTDLTDENRSSHRADPAQGRPARPSAAPTSKPPSGSRSSRASRRRQDRATSVDQLDFEFVLFASAVIDYDYIMRPHRQASRSRSPGKPKMSREQLIGLIAVRRQVPRRARGDHRVRPHAQGGRRPRRSRHPRRLPAVQGREGRRGAGRPSPRSTACRRRRCKPSSTPSSAA